MSGKSHVIIVAAAIAAAAAMLLMSCGKNNPAGSSATATDTPDWTATPTYTITGTFTITKTHTITETAIDTGTSTCSPTATVTATVTPTFTATKTHTPSTLTFKQGLSGYTGAYDGSIAGPPYQTASTSGCPDLVAGYASLFPARMLFKFDLSSYSGQVVSARLDLNVMTYSSATITGYALLADWNEGTGCSPSTEAGAVNWQSSGLLAWSTPGGDFSASPATNTLSISSGGLKSFVLDTALVQSWIDNSSANYGIILKAADESSSAGFVQFNAKESATPGVNPALVVDIIQ